VSCTVYALAGDPSTNALTIVVILQDQDLLSAVYGDKYGGGELIFARSSYKALKDSNYTLVYHKADIRNLNDIVKEKYKGWDKIHLVFVERSALEACEISKDFITHLHLTLMVSQAGKYSSIHFG
jgi:hypothetical protein